MTICRHPDDDDDDDRSVSDARDDDAKSFEKELLHLLERTQTDDHQSPVNKA